jgi:hypothetical protein
LESHLLKPFLYFNNRKCWNNIQYTQIKIHLIQSVSCFGQEWRSQQFFRYAMFKLLLLGYLLQKKVEISPNASGFIWFYLKSSHISFFLIKLN